jgi:hypothetical protein
MKVVLLAVLLAASLGSAAFADPPGDALSAKAKECITSAAASVAARSHDLSDAVNFLVSDLCSVEIQHANAYFQSKRALEQLQATTASNQLAGVTVDTMTGELKTPPGFEMPLNTTTIMLNAMRAGSDQFANFRSIAARAVLAAEAK